jgi:sortase A
VLRALHWLLLSGGSILVGAFMLGRADSWWYEAREGGRLEAALREGSGMPGPSLLGRADGARTLASSGGAWGRLELPRLALSALIAEGVDARTLRRAVGHLPGSAFPGETGDVALAGHRDTFFRALEHVREGDLVHVETPDGRFFYRIESLRLAAADDRDALVSSSRPTLTLVTCHPFDDVGPAPRRLLVYARQVEAALMASVLPWSDPVFAAAH